MIVSFAKLAANRANARKSTGPKTVAGKAQAAQNGKKSKGPRTTAGKRICAGNAEKSTGPKTLLGKQRVAQNGQKSTGPRTAAGKERSARNARRHGLTQPANCEPDAQSAIAHLTHALVQESGGTAALPGALRVAAAQFDLMRVRRAREPLYAQAFAQPTSEAIRRLAALERYERRARSQRKAAIRDFKMLGTGAADPAQETTKRTKPNQ